MPITFETDLRNGTLFPIIVSTFLANVDSSREEAAWYFQKSLDFAI
jgi:hypothetical protein